MGKMITNLKVIEHHNALQWHSTVSHNNDWQMEYQYNSISWHRVIHNCLQILITLLILSQCCKNWLNCYESVQNVANFNSRCVCGGESQLSLKHPSSDKEHVPPPLPQDLMSIVLGRWFSSPHAKADTVFSLAADILASGHALLAPLLVLCHMRSCVIGHEENGTYRLMMMMTMMTTTMTTTTIIFKFCPFWH